MKTENETFMIQARRCQRCGGILISKNGIDEGYGHVCKKKMLQEKTAALPIFGQINLFDHAKESEDLL